MNPSPGYIFGETLTVMLVVALAIVKVPLAQCPAMSADPPMLPVTPDSGMAPDCTAPNTP